jgi:hypothetical protein
MIPSGYSLDSNRSYPNPVIIRSITDTNINMYQNRSKILFSKENYNLAAIQDNTAKIIIQNLQKTFYEKPGQYTPEKFVADKLLVDKIIAPELIDKEKIDYQINKAIELKKNIIEFFFKLNMTINRFLHSLLISKLFWKNSKKTAHPLKEGVSF